MTTSTKAIAAVEFLKLLRSGWYSRRQIQNELDWSELTVARWVDEWLANGLLREAQGLQKAANGYAPKVFTLAPEWGGVDHPLPKDKESTS